MTQYNIAVSLNFSVVLEADPENPEPEIREYLNRLSEDELRELIDFSTIEPFDHFQTDY